MSRQNLVPALIAAFIIIGAFVGIFVYHGFEFARVDQVAGIENRTSALYARMKIVYAKPPIGSEAYVAQDVNGVSKYSYRVTPYNGGRAYTISMPTKRTYDVSFFFGQLVQDGVWDLMNKPPRGDTTARYIVYVKQIADARQGDRTVLFTDPKYWAVTAGRQYSIDLRKDKPSDLLKLNSTSIADPHYLAVVNDFREFGTDAFRAKVAQAQAAVRAGH